VETSTRNSLDRLAPVYDFLGTIAFAGQLHASQRALLQAVPPRQRVLVIGGGTGRFLGEFLTHDTQADVVYVDPSAAMLARARHRVNPHDSGRVIFLHGSVDAITPDDRFDLICTQCVLDCFSPDELLPFMQRLDANLEPGGAWLFHDFHTADGTAFSRLWRRSVVWALYRFFRLTTDISARALPPMLPTFADLGYTETAGTSHCGGLLIGRLLEKG
jgi:tRNA (cmo5U34)-methyltransferase